MRNRAAVWTGLLVALMAEPVLACAVCHGDPDSELVRGARAGVIVLAVIVYLVLFTMLGVAGTWMMRARRLSRADQADADQTISQA